MDVLWLPETYADANIQILKANSKLTLKGHVGTASKKTIGPN